MAARGQSLHIGVNKVDPAHYNGWEGTLAACEFDAEDMRALAVGNHKKQQAFDENMGSYLESLAGYAAIAIANARLFTALERRAREMERAYEELKTHKQ